MKSILNPIIGTSNGVHLKKTRTNILLNDGLADDESDSDLDFTSKKNTNSSIHSISKFLLGKDRYGIEIFLNETTVKVFDERDEDEEEDTINYKIIYDKGGFLLKNSETIKNLSTSLDLFPELLRNKLLIVVT